MKHPIFWFGLFILIFQQASAQWNPSLLQPVSLVNMDFFKPAAANWKLESKANCLRDVNHNIETTPGNGVLVNRPNAVNKDNLISQNSFGDLDFEFDFMMAKGSNSGIYLMGRYEIQLFDSWGKESPGFADCGGIYQRWDLARGKGREGYEGNAPLSNECKAPGLWQNMRISFDAPKFDNNGTKIKNALVKAVWLNGIKVQTQYELSGPTRGPLSEKEAATGPILIQGDHGPLAFRNFRYATYDAKPIEVKSLKYKVYNGTFDQLQLPANAKIVKEGNAAVIDKGHTDSDDDFYIRYEGKMMVFNPGIYEFTCQFSGRYAVIFDGDTVSKSHEKVNWWDKNRASVSLSSGEHSLVIVNSKSYPERKNAMGLSYTGPGMREQNLHAENSVANGTGGETMFLNRQDMPFVQRSFYYYNGQRRAYGINVCDPKGTHFTVNAPTGRINRAWHSAIFGDVTGMWVDRGGQQIFSPCGFSLELTDKSVLGLSPENYADTILRSDGFYYLGYQLKHGQQPVFCYYTKWGELMLQASFSDFKMNWEGILKQANFHQSIPFHLIAEGKRIEQMKDGSFLVDDKYYIIPDPSIDAATKITDADGNQKLFIQLTGTGNDMKFKYSIIW